MVVVAFVVEGLARSVVVVVVVVVEEEMVPPNLFLLSFCRDGREPEFLKLEKGLLVLDRSSPLLFSAAATVSNSD